MGQAIVPAAALQGGWTRGKRVRGQNCPAELPAPHQRSYRGFGASTFLNPAGTENSLSLMAAVEKFAYSVIISMSEPGVLAGLKK